MKLLYAEDDKNLRTSLTELLQLKGHEVDAVENGEDLLARLASGTYDGVITDNDMSPGMSGLTALRHLRADVRQEDLPVVFLSANTDAGKEAEKLGAIYLDKMDAGSKQVLDALEKLRTKRA